MPLKPPDPSLSCGAQQNSVNSIARAESASTAAAGGISNIGIVDKLFARTVDAQLASDWAQYQTMSQQELGCVIDHPYLKTGTHKIQEYDRAIRAITTQPLHALELGGLQGGKKLDSGKAPVAQGFIAYFRKAMEAVAKVSEYGAKKYAVTYSEQNWRRVENAANRYADSLARHFAAHVAGEANDPESGLPHIDHVSWNANALIELREAQSGK